MGIESTDKQSIGDILKNRYPFSLPSHQRAYSWTNEEIKTFCEDIQTIDKEYFFGGIVSVQQNASNLPGRINKVVDGQQRLATFTLVLVHLKNAFKKLSEQAAQKKDEVIEKSAHALYLEVEDNHLKYNETTIRPPAEKYRLTLSDMDQEYFQNMIQGNPVEEKSSSHNNLKRAWSTLKKILIDPIFKDKKEPLNIKLDKLEDLKNKILKKSVVIHIVTNDLNDAYQLYEVLNDRGRTLETGDFLRSTTLELLEKHQDLQSKIASYWDAILGKHSADKYLKDYYASIYGSVKSHNIHKQFEDAFFKYDPNQVNYDEAIKIHNEVKQIYDSLEVYKAITDGEWPYLNSKATNAWKKNRLNILINQLKHTSSVPLLLAIYREKEEQDFLETVLMLEKVVFRYISIGEQRANKLIEIYKNHILKIKNNQSNTEDLKDDLKEFIIKQSSDETFTNNLEKLTYNHNNIKKIRYFLCALEEHNRSYIEHGQSKTLIPNYAITHNIDTIHIEHIYPQNSKKPVEAMERIKDNLSNLTLWIDSDNISALNKDFLLKRDKYSSSHVSLTKELGKLSEWGETQVKDRMNLYKHMALAIFKL